VTNDTVHFWGCNEQTIAGDMTVNISCEAGNEVLDVEATQMPLCSLGSNFIVVGSDICAGSQRINVTLIADVPNSQRKLIIDLAVDRESSKDTNIADWNSTLSLFQSPHLHEYYVHGSQTIEANCTNTNASYNINASEVITIVNLPPEVNVNQLLMPDSTLINLTDNIVIEYQNGTWQFIISVTDDDLDTVNITIYNSSAPVFSTLNISAITPASSLFRDFDEAPFSINISANDTNGDSTNVSISFNVNDTVNPSCDFETNYSVPINGTFSFNVTCTDESFFELNVTCPTNNYTNFTTGLNTESFSFTDSISNVVADTCSFRYCDGHTAKELSKDWWVSTNVNKFEFYAGSDLNELLLDDLNNPELNYSIEQDRVTFSVKIHPSEKKSEYNFYYNTSPDSYYLKDDEYKAWIVDRKSLTWFDLNGLDGSVHVSKKSGGLWKIKVRTDSLDLQFRSIGELNCVSGSFTLEDRWRNWGSFTPDTCLLDGELNSVFMLFGMIFTLVAFFVLNELFIKLHLLTYLIGVGFFVIAVNIWGCSVLMSLPFIFFAFALWIYELVIMTGAKQAQRG